MKAAAASLRLASGEERICRYVAKRYVGCRQQLWIEAEW